MKSTIFFIISVTISTLFLGSSTVSAGFIGSTIFNAAKKAGAIAGNAIENTKTTIKSVGQTVAEKAAEDIETLKKAGGIIKDKLANVGNTVNDLTNNVAVIVGHTVKKIQTKATEDLQFLKDGASQLAHDATVTLAVETLKNAVAGVKKAVEIASDTNDADVKDGLEQISNWLEKFEGIIASIIIEPKDIEDE